MDDLIGFLNARLDEDRTTADDESAAGTRYTADRIHKDVAADRKLIARYTAAVESHAHALQMLRSLAGDPDADPARRAAAQEDVAACHGQAAALLAVLEDRAERFDDHPDYQPSWRP
ncbi:hypothetical protein Psi01_58880 [Planobispora siamensis]|uniref:Uncharacterized protein n=2 Tax=Planobispora siamensis TaxID=936338 RepID=A0A8J3SJ00_9ACTN|nr:hypothetical protein Psi01_58880 [Planobispora siamensis]